MAWLWPRGGAGGTAIKKLSADARFAACYPVPLDDDPDPAAERTPEGQAARRKAITALGRTWARLGFEHFRDGVHVLDLGLVTFEEKLCGLHKSVPAPLDARHIGPV